MNAADDEVPFPDEPSASGLWSALFAIQKEIGALTKGADNPFYKSTYVPLPDLLKAVLPLTEKYGLLLMQDVRQTAHGPVVVTSFRHVASGHFTEDSYPVICADATNAQAFGGAVSYARRYGLKARLAIIELDDDGNAASTRRGAAAPQNAASAPKSAPSPQPDRGGQGKPSPAPKASGKRQNTPRADDAQAILELAVLLDQDAEDRGEKFRILKGPEKVGIYGKVAVAVGVEPGAYAAHALTAQQAADLRSFYEYLCKKNDIVLPDDDGEPF